jgi:long-chain fatty acid transport protein
MKRLALVLAIASVSLSSSGAWAGGFEFPDNGTEALGRGGAFTAKADDATALEYNVAGLARQRGTRLLLDANLVFDTYEFQRSGAFPDNPSDPATPYGGQPFPKVANRGGPFFAPFFGISTDLGLFDRWTFSVGAYGPSSYGSRNYPITVDGKPAASRYDVGSTNLLIIYPTLAAAVRVTKWLDLGLALHLVVGSFNFASVAFVDTGRSQCPNVEYAPCDSTTTLSVTGVTATASLGAMFHATPALSIGVNVRGPAEIHATGTASGTPPIKNPIPIEPDRASLDTKLPWVVRLGVRYAFLKGAFERGDVELDGTYEAWHEAEGDGDHVNIPNLAIFSNITPTLTHHYKDTYSVRAGGAYHFELPAGVLTLRLGVFYDSSATNDADTRLDFDTLAKVAPTAGIGYQVRGVSINLGYAYLWTPDRNVTNGDIQPINPVQMGSGNSSTFDKQGNPIPLPPVNNGFYHGAIQILSIGLTVNWDEALKKKRVIRYQ